MLLDEAYDQLYYTPERPTPLWLHEDLRERSIVMHTLSKMFGTFVLGCLVYVRDSPVGATGRDGRTHLWALACACA